MKATTKKIIGWHAAIKTQGFMPCNICTLPITADGWYGDVFLGKLTIDHVIPKSRGGPDIKQNIKAAHSSCNQLKGNIIGFVLTPNQALAHARGEAIDIPFNSVSIQPLDG